MPALSRLGWVTACVALAWFFPAQSRGQVLYPDGLEYAVHAPRPGDQVRPDVRIHGQKGIAVWEDNAIDRYDLGIAACWLDVSGQPTGAPFRVTSTWFGDQTRPVVGLLTNGGAVFGFQGYEVLKRWRLGSADAYIRFMNANGTFAGRDIPLSQPPVRLSTVVYTNVVAWWQNRRVHRRWPIRTTTYFRRDQTEDPQLEVWPDSRVLVAYSGDRRVETNTFEIVTRVDARLWRGWWYYRTNDVFQPLNLVDQSRRDVFFRVYGSDRRLAVPETRVNQITANNQQQPAVAILSDGRFVVVWVSEDFLAETPEETSRVVIRGRLFQSDGAPSGDEFLVSAETARCAKPDVAARADGGFAVVWNQIAAAFTNRWDVYARGYDNQGGALEEPFLVNTTTFGDQHAPSVSAVPAGEFVVWTSKVPDPIDIGEANSLGSVNPAELLAWARQRQDRSREGIFGRFLDAIGTMSEEFRINTTTVGQQFHPVSVANGHNGMWAVWSAFTIDHGFELRGQAYRAPTIQVLPPRETRVPTTGGTLPPLPGPVVVGPADVGMVLPSRTVTTNGSPGTVTAARPEVRVAARFAGSMVELSWNTIAGRSYQVQTSSDLSLWVDMGLPRIAAGDRDGLLLNPKEEVAWYRVIELP